MSSPNNITAAAAAFPLLPGCDGSLHLRAQHPGWPVCRCAVRAVPDLLQQASRAGPAVSSGALCSFMWAVTQPWQATVNRGCIRCYTC